MPAFMRIGRRCHNAKYRGCGGRGTGESDEEDGIVSTARDARFLGFLRFLFLFCVVVRELCVAGQQFVRTQAREHRDRPPEQFWKYTRDARARVTMAALVVLQAAQLGFITPIGVVNTLEAGSQVNVSWTSPWPLTTLQLWRGPSADDGSYTVDILGENLPPTTNSYPWMAPGAESEANQFSPEVYFRLQKSDLPNECEQCVASSSVFTVAAAGAAAVPAAVPSASDDATPSATSGAETSAAEESTAATTAASMASETAPSTTTEDSASMTAEEPSSMSTEAPASATTDEAASTTTEATESDMTTATAETSATEMSSSAAESSGMTTMVNPSIIESSPDATAASEPFVFTPVTMSQFDRATELGLGIGLGLGIPILLVVMGLVVLLLHRRERRRVQEEQFEGIFHAQTR